MVSGEFKKGDEVTTVGTSECYMGDWYELARERDRELIPMTW